MFPRMCEIEEKNNAFPSGDDKNYEECKGAFYALC